MTSTPSKKTKYSREFRLSCKNKYEIEGMKPQEISGLMSVPVEVLSLWKSRGKWLRKEAEISKIEALTQDMVREKFATLGMPLDEVFRQMIGEIQKTTTDGPESRAKMVYIEKYLGLIGMGEAKGPTIKAGEGGVVNFNITSGGVELPALKEVKIVDSTVKRRA